MQPLITYIGRDGAMKADYKGMQKSEERKRERERVKSGHGCIS